jgi:phospholipid/cholesterol/gamma-HCH transport system permease protein
MARMNGLLVDIGSGVKDRAKRVLYAMGFFFNVVKEFFLFFRRRQVGYKVLTMQILFTGVEALGVSAVLAVGIGAAINIIGSSILPTFGQSALMYPILIAVITRELGPLLTAFIIIARSGTAIATELGNMVVSHEIEAYVAFGINPISFLVVPRIVGVTVAMVVLNVYFNLFGLLGSYLVVQFVKPIGVMEYFLPLFKALTWNDLSIGLLKSLTFGVITSVVSTYQGFSVNRAVTEIPVAGIRAVSQNFLFCVVADVLLTVLHYAL